jgi:hypothetical protein
MHKLSEIVYEDVIPAFHAAPADPEFYLSSIPYHEIRYIILLVLNLTKQPWAMKIKKVQLTGKDRRRAYKSAVRKALREAGIDKLTGTKVFRNKKKYTRKGKEQVIRREQGLT